MNISMTVLTDGRKQYLEKSLPTWIKAYGDQLDIVTIIDDSGNSGYRHWLIETFPDFIVTSVGRDRCGYAAAMRRVFEVIRLEEADYNLHVEDDFILHNPPMLQDVCSILEANPDLAQISMMRQPWYPNEIRHGGVIEALEFNGSVFNKMETNGLPWTQHQAYFTCNPSIFPQWLAHREWPDAPWCEMKFGQSLVSDNKTYGIWGSRNDWICVEHIGEVRNGIEY